MDDLEQKTTTYSRNKTVLTFQLVQQEGNEMCASDE